VLPMSKCKCCRTAMHPLAMHPSHVLHAHAICIIKLFLIFDMPLPLVYCRYRFCYAVSVIWMRCSRRRPFLPTWARASWPPRRI
jgi:hypothetical protein